ncbi:ATP-dependent Clp protease proteolytic subunit [Bacteroides acidifaciens]|uniref:ATP-dependent Clp protease proteolytic subunit n=1 Tax=Bacteroides acidifaciens TaxID=85831 RepID=UPI00261B7610|nr:ATP-dependent Clp protease proteolytic subunit [Bacteroides acidifaciens]
MKDSIDVIRLDFLDSINTSSAKEFIDKLKGCSMQRPDANCIWINISSPGGDIDVAIELYNFLKQLDCCVITNNISVVNSAAILLYLAGDERYCDYTSTFYVHSVTKKLRGIFDADRLIREAKELKINTNRVVKIISDNTLPSSTYWNRLMNKGEIIASKQAIKLGLSTHIFSRNNDQ